MSVGEFVFLSACAVVVCLVMAFIAWLPVREAHKRHHPAADAIQCVAFLSMLFPPLWLVAFVWAHTAKKP